MYTYIHIYTYNYVYIYMYVCIFFLSAQRTHWYVKEQIQPISVIWVSVILFYFFSYLM